MVVTHTKAKKSLRVRASGQTLDVFPPKLTASAPRSHD